MIRRLLPYFRSLWARLVVATVCMAGVAAISTAMVWMMKYLFDNALAEKDVDSLRIAIVLILAGFALKSMLWYSHTYLTAYVGQMIAMRLRNQLYRHLYSLSMGFFDEKTSGNIMARLTNDVNTVQIALASGPTTVIRDGLTIIALIGFIFYLHWRFAFLCFAIIPFAVLVLVHLGRKSRKAGRESQAQMADMYDTIKESVTAMPIVQTYQNEEKEIREFTDANRNYFNVIMRLARINARSSPVMEVLGSFILALILGIGGRDVIQGEWTVGAFVAFVSAAMSLYNPIKKFATVNVQIQTGLAALERLFQVLDQPPLVLDKPGAEAAPVLASAIEFRRVSFSYAQSDVVLKGIDLTLRKGEIVALVGASGSGKSTVASLLLRFYDPTDGGVFFDGRDVRDFSLASLRRQMAVVTQETHLFNDTVYANIEYGRPGASREDVEAAARAAYAHDFIARLPRGYATVIGERGTRLSGGEKQRLAIARSLLKNPGVLILDEATSALDSESEKAVQKALDRLLEGRTVLMIAHRLSTVRKADRIVVLESGKILEAGTHDDLLRRNGRYRQLYDLQALA